jgi:6-pyruvoyltetrahydropterin/6-carboxytetrahydropterin synthase
MQGTHYSEKYSNVLDKQYFNFASAHFLIFASGEREPLHGHNYAAELEIEGALDTASLVADFIEVKPIFKRACDTLDHRVLLPKHNPHLAVVQDERTTRATWRGDTFQFPNQDVVLLECDNTSSENLARAVCDQFLAGLRISLPSLVLRRVAVTVSESPGQAARYERQWRDESITLTSPLRRRRRPLTAFGASPLALENVNGNLSV